MTRRVSLDKSTALRMGRATLITESRNISPATTPRRWRHPRGGGGGSPATYVRIIKSVPSFGRTQDAAEIYVFNSDALVFDWEPVYTNPDAAPEDPDYQVITKIGIINSGYEPIRASEAIPIGGNGVDIYSITEIEEGDESPEPVESLYRYLVLQNVYDLASLAGMEETTIDGEPQGPSHPSGSRHFGLDGGPCETEGA